MGIRLLRISPSAKSDKKFDASFEVDGRLKVVSFGARGMDDFTLTGDVSQQRRYQLRHRNDRLDDPLSAGSLSWFVLWSSRTLAGGIANYKRHFKL